jgi:hypothetical protein
MLNSDLNSTVNNEIEEVRNEFEPRITTFSCILPGNYPILPRISHFWSKPVYPAHFTPNCPVCPTGLDFCLFT